MKSFFTTIRNIWGIDELRERILFTLLLLLVYRVGCHVLLPGVNSDVLSDSFSSNSPNDILGLINAFAGGAFGRAAIFALGIMPYITASIIIQLLGFAVPYFQRLQNKEGESGRRKLTQITRALTIAITIIQSNAFLAYIKSLGAIDPSIPVGIFWVSSIIILSAGTIFAMWLGEKITDRGIGNGVSLIIMIGIIATLPQALLFEFTSQLNSGGLLIFVLELAALFAVTMITVLIIQGVRRIPIQFAKRMMGRGSSALPAQGARDYIPLKVAAAGVMPIIFAQALMFVPSLISGWFVENTDAGSGFAAAFSDIASLPYNIIFFSLVVLFTYVYTALLVNPKQYSEYLKRQNAFIPGIRPGSATEDFIDTVTSRVTLPGAIFLGLISVLPALAMAFGINQGFALFFGGTSLLILVGVVLDTLQQIESYLLMRKYDGLVKGGKIKGRSSMQTIGSDL